MLQISQLPGQPPSAVAVIVAPRKKSAFPLMGYRGSTVILVDSFSNLQDEAVMCALCTVCS